MGEKGICSISTYFVYNVVTDLTPDHIIDIYSLHTTHAQIMKYGAETATPSIHTHEVCYCASRLQKHQDSKSADFNRFPVQVNLTAGDLKTEVTKALGCAQCILSGRGSSW